MTRLFFLLCLIVLCKGNESNSLKLEQVLILSRHNIRTPLTSKLKSYAPKLWPKFNEPVAHLTRKGVLLESYMAEYIYEWLASKDFFKGCPKQDEVLIYSNTKSRTRDTAKAFAEAAFPSCNISAQHYDNIDVFDPLFFPIFHNNSEDFKQTMIKEMERKIKETDLTELYLELNRILDLQNSDKCKLNSVCDFSKIKSTVIYEEGEEPNVAGPLFVGTQIVDTFVMGYYEGFPLEDVAWGEIKTDDQWKLLANIMRVNLDVRFNFKPGSEDIARPLLNYMFNIFRNGTPKFTMLVGHDANMNSVTNALRFKDFELKDQFEPYPIGGKLLFEKWTDGEKKYLKIEYVYQTFSQLRNGNKLSMADPPHTVVLELNDCKIDENGFCPWEDFMKLNF